MTRLVTTHLDLPARIGPVIRTLRRSTDPLFRQAGIDLDEG